ncbi:hypothetical protein [Nocardioides sp. B-3]|uniref:hypothetical protein n=1 Tax=Nocardioides sp. B-3 TaxID=2895565 RepID=UPI003FA5546C
MIQNMDAGHIDPVILDGEAVPAGGLGIAKQLKDEIYQCPPVLVLTGRPRDARARHVVARRGRRAAPDRPGAARGSRRVAASGASALPPLPDPQGFSQIRLPSRAAAIMMAGIPRTTGFVSRSAKVFECRARSLGTSRMSWIDPTVMAQA